jgi:type IV pilus assembly protein PilV
MRSSNHTHPRARLRGVSLIEVLVAILIFSFGIIGLMGLQARALLFSTSAEDTSRAALLANELASSMVINGTVNTGALVPAGTYTNWASRVATPASGGLPSGVPSIAASGNSATITIQWQPQSSAGASFNRTNQYVTTVTLP